jgi:hypothetical protein
MADLGFKVQSFKRAKLLTSGFELQRKNLALKQREVVGDSD